MVNVNVAQGAVAATWATELDFDWAAQGNGSVALPDGLKTIGSQQWRFGNLGNLDSDQATITSGTGLVMPNDTANVTWFGNTQTAPFVGVHVLDVFPTYRLSTHEVRFWWRFTATQSVASADGPLVSVHTYPRSNDQGSGLFRDVTSSGCNWKPIAHLNGTGQDQGTQDPQSNPIDDVVMVHVVSQSEHRWYTGKWASGWPDPLNLTPRKVMFPVSNGANMSGNYWEESTMVCLIAGATNNTSGTHDMTIKNTRVDVKAVS